MTPKSFVIIDGVSHFRYDKEKFAEWTKQGELTGDVGMLILSRDGDWVKYGGYGTIDHPCKTLSYITLMHFPLFDGEMPTDEERVNPPQQESKLMGHKFIMLDLSKKDENN